ncbi:zinc finger and SCAN domain-containing protein 20-like [Hirundo rustica]|uniref:zinc finger and SCAN domain-containing protein 20-like n=1 Tax=Hirundo rustica TaxID=43150 RepID=UPI002673764F|nr:zinc finger and SCAN domain-containing protein 20-like [Hirundo rustica]
MFASCRNPELSRNGPRGVLVEVPRGDCLALVGRAAISGSGILERAGAKRESPGVYRAQRGNPGAGGPPRQPGGVGEPQDELGLTPKRWQDGGGGHHEEEEDGPGAPGSSDWKGFFNLPNYNMEGIPRDACLSLADTCRFKPRQWGSTLGQGSSQRCSQSSELSVHELLHDWEKTHKWSKCEKSFSKRCSLICHWRIHRGEQPYKCGERGKSFS